jgi:hypothetical protein
MPTYQSKRRKGLAAMDGAIALMSVLLVVQMWLFSATLESILAGDKGVAGAAAVVSLVLTCACWVLYRLLQKINRSVQNK